MFSLPIVRGVGATSQRGVRGVGATRKAALLSLRGPTGQNDSQCCGAYTNHGGGCRSAGEPFWVAIMNYDSGTRSPPKTFRSDHA
ncbi:hypothetical protein [Dictyobacter alpinus]|uniref:hypothetical protein n=1 Tax=Dictyobacter alpinus TaxID=2014873 RepID=UPI000F82E6DD|nr:hypothetical protein [Dictyobacter alpinus]